MGIPQDNMNFSLSPPDHPLSKRRRFTSTNLPPTIPFSDNSSISTHLFDSPLIHNSDLCDRSPLPEEIQADLLQVGMRIRKAVPEGYKTHKFTPRPFFNMRRLSPETQAAINGSGSNSPDVSPYSAGRLHNVGGMAMQPIATATFCGINLASLSALSDSGDSWKSSYSSPQGLWSYSTSHKRKEDFEDDSDEQEWSPAPQTPTLMADNGSSMPIDYFTMDMENMCDMDVSPFTTRWGAAPLKQASAVGLNARKISKPKSRVRQAAPVAEAQKMFNPFTNMVMLPEQEVVHIAASHQTHGHTRIISCGMEMVNDFGDAGFLQRREDVEMDCS